MHVVTSYLIVAVAVHSQKAPTIINPVIEVSQDVQASKFLFKNYMDYYIIDKICHKERAELEYFLFPTILYLN